MQCNLMTKLENFSLKTEKTLLPLQLIETMIECSRKVNALKTCLMYICIPLECDKQQNEEKKQFVVYFANIC